MPKLKWGQTLARDQINVLLTTHDKEHDGKFSRLRADNDNEIAEEALDDKRQRDRTAFWGENTQYWQGTDKKSLSRRQEWDNYRGDRTKRHNKENNKIDRKYVKGKKRDTKQYAAANTNHQEKWYGKEGEPTQPGVWQAVETRKTNENETSTQANTNYLTKRIARHTQEDLQREYDKAQYWIDQVKLQLQQERNLNPLIETVEQIPQDSKAKARKELIKQFDTLATDYDKAVFERPTVAKALALGRRFDIPRKKNNVNKAFKLVNMPDNVIKKSFYDSLNSTEEEEILSALIETIDAIQVNDPIVEVEQAPAAPKSTARIARDEQFSAIADKYTAFEQLTVEQVLASEQPLDQRLTEIHRQGREARAAYHSLKDISLANQHEKTWDDRKATHDKENKVTQAKHVTFDFAERQKTYQQNEKELLAESDYDFTERTQRHQDENKVFQDARDKFWEARATLQGEENTTRKTERTNYGPDRIKRHKNEDNTTQSIKDNYVKNRKERHQKEDKPLNDERKTFWGDRKTRQDQENADQKLNKGWQDWNTAQIPLQNKTNSARTDFRAKNETARLANESLEDGKLQNYYNDLRATIAGERRNTDIGYNKTWGEERAAGVQLKGETYTWLAHTAALKVHRPFHDWWINREQRHYEFRLNKSRAIASAYRQAKEEFYDAGLSVYRGSNYGAHYAAYGVLPAVRMITRPIGWCAYSGAQVAYDRMQDTYRLSGRGIDNTVMFMQDHTRWSYRAIGRAFDASAHGVADLSRSSSRLAGYLWKGAKEKTYDCSLDKYRRIGYGWDSTKKYAAIADRYLQKTFEYGWYQAKDIMLSIARPCYRVSDWCWKNAQQGLAWAGRSGYRGSGSAWDLTKETTAIPARAGWRVSGRGSDNVLTSMHLWLARPGYRVLERCGNNIAQGMDWIGVNGGRMMTQSWNAAKHHTALWVGRPLWRTSGCVSDNTQVIGANMVRPLSQVVSQIGQSFEETGQDMYSKIGRGFLNCDPAAHYDRHNAEQLLVHKANTSKTEELTPVIPCSGGAQPVAGMGNEQDYKSNVVIDTSVVSNIVVDKQ